MALVIVLALLTGVAVAHPVVHAEDPRVKECLQFLHDNSPPSDANLSPEFLLNNTILALKARDAMSFARAVPWAIFLNDVLPYAVMSEARQAWRSELYTVVAPMVANATTLESATLAVAKNLWSAWGPPAIHYVGALPDKVNAYAPLDVIQAHNASCTGISILFACALRAVGVPARVAGVPHWNSGEKACPKGDADASCGNHDWTEVWFNEQWSFLDATSTHTAFNSSWFYPGKISKQVPHIASPFFGNHSVWASSFKQTPGSRFPMVWDWSFPLPGVDVTERYVHPSSALATLAGESGNGTCQSNLCQPCLPPVNGSVGPGTCCNQTWMCFFDGIAGHNLCLPPYHWIC